MQGVVFMDTSFATVLVMQLLLCTGLNNAVPRGLKENGLDIVPVRWKITWVPFDAGDRM